MRSTIVGDPIHTRFERIAALTSEDCVPGRLVEASECHGESSSEKKAIHCEDNNVKVVKMSDENMVSKKTTKLLMELGDNTKRERLT